MRLVFILTLTLSFVVSVVSAQMPAGNGDLNCDGEALDIADLVTAVDYMFNGGPQPCEFVGPSIVSSQCDECGNFRLMHETWENLLSITVEPPGPGFLHVTFNVIGVQIGGPLAPAANLDTVPDGGGLSSSDAGSTPTTSYGVASVVYTLPVSDTAVTVYGNLSACSEGNNRDYAIREARLTAMYFPAIGGGE